MEPYGWLRGTKVMSLSVGHSEARSEILIVRRRAVPTIALAWGEEPDLGPLGRVVNGSATTRAGKSLAVESVV